MSKRSVFKTKLKALQDLIRFYYGNDEPSAYAYKKRQRGTYKTRVKEKVSWKRSDGSSGSRYKTKNQWVRSSLGITHTPCDAPYSSTEHTIHGFLGQWATNRGGHVDRFRHQPHLAKPLGYHYSGTMYYHGTTLWSYNHPIAVLDTDTKTVFLSNARFMNPEALPGAYWKNQLSRSTYKRQRTLHTMAINRGWTVLLVPECPQSLTESWLETLIQYYIDFILNRLVHFYRCAQDETRKATLAEIEENAAYLKHLADIFCMEKAQTGHRIAQNTLEYLNANPTFIKIKPKHMMQ